MEPDPDSTSESFAAYAVETNDTDPLTRAIQELIDHAACQEERINRLCSALEEMGQRIDDSETPLNKERLNRLLR